MLAGKTYDNEENSSGKREEKTWCSSSGSHVVILSRKGREAVFRWSVRRCGGWTERKRQGLTGRLSSGRYLGGREGGWRIGCGLIAAAGREELELEPRHITS